MEIRRLLETLRLHGGEIRFEHWRPPLTKEASSVCHIRLGPIHNARFEAMGDPNWLATKFEETFRKLEDLVE
jgi:hypothetical protein